MCADTTGRVRVFMSQDHLRLAAEDDLFASGDGLSAIAAPQFLATAGDWSHRSHVARSSQWHRLRPQSVIDRS
jgi:hypothetical protein